MWDQSLVQQLQHFNARIFSEISVNTFPSLLQGYVPKKSLGGKKVAKTVIHIAQKRAGRP